MKEFLQTTAHSKKRNHMYCEVLEQAVYFQEGGLDQDLGVFTLVRWSFV